MAMNKPKEKSGAGSQYAYVPGQDRLSEGEGIVQWALIFRDIGLLLLGLIEVVAMAFLRPVVSTLSGAPLTPVWPQMGTHHAGLWWAMFAAFGVALVGVFLVVYGLYRYQASETGDGAERVQIRRIALVLA